MSIANETVLVFLGLIVFWELARVSARVVWTVFVLGAIFFLAKLWVKTMARSDEKRNYIKYL